MVHQNTTDHATSEFLDKAELRELTGKARAKAQAQWLEEQGVAHRLVDRRVIVSRHHARKWLEGHTVVTSSGPDWSAVR
jgi:hypothetical protein